MNAMTPSVAGQPKATPVDTFAEAAQAFDNQLQAMAGRATGGLSPLGLGKALNDWMGHLMASPGKQLTLMQSFAELASTGWLGAERDPALHDPRFRGERWSAWPYSAYANAFAGLEAAWADAFEINGVSERHRRVSAFAMRQVLDAFAPSNFLATNPDAIARCVETGGLSALLGLRNFLYDAASALAGDGQQAVQFRPGEAVAATPGVVVARTGLAEVIQYAPTRPAVHAEPVVIVPAPIMKYYILDLTPQDSVVRGLLDQGFTVFMVSWKNPREPERDCGFCDYIREGVRAALKVAAEITGAPQAHLVGYCLGGTMSAMTAAALAAEEDRSLASLSLLAAQGDFTEAGDFSLFINESQVSLLEQAMRDRGYLLPEQMTGALYMLRDNELIWSRWVRSYLFGETSPRTPLDDWAADATRLPYRLESENLRQLYLTNALAEGRFSLGGRPLALRDIEVDMFVLGTETDHIAPWRSVYKWLLMCEADITFVLANHGHNVGVVAPPGRPGLRHRRRDQGSQALYMDPDAWFAGAAAQEGSWQTPWFEWLKARSGAEVAPPPLGGAAGRDLGPAPGGYVMER